MNVIAGDRSLTIADMVALADPETTLAISDDAWKRIADARAIADEELERGAVVYGLRSEEHTSELQSH